MTPVLYVAIGGAIGSVARYLLSGVVPSANGFPYGILSVNVTGCFVMGLLAGYKHGNQLSDSIALLTMTGFCGGFTTFSAFSQDTFELVLAKSYLSAILNVVASVLGGCCATYFGYFITRP